MRSIRYLPLVFVIGIDGFAMFAPYVVAMYALDYAIRLLRANPLA